MFESKHPSQLMARKCMNRLIMVDDHKILVAKPPKYATKHLWLATITYAQGEPVVSYL